MIAYSEDGGVEASKNLFPAIELLNDTQERGNCHCRRSRGVDPSINLRPRF